MGCSASKTSEVVVPMPEKPKDNTENAKVTDENAINRKSSGSSTKRKVIQVKESDSDSLRGSKTSLRSKSSKTSADRESSAKSTRTADSGVCESEEDETPMITESSKPADFNEDRPPTPDLSIEGQKVPRRKSPKEKRVSFSEQQDAVRSRISSLSPLGGVTERPQSRGGMAFDVMLAPETGNVKRRPAQLKSLERRRRKSKRRTKEEIEEKLIRADERRKEHEQQLKEKAQAMMAKERIKNALDEFAMRQTIKEQETA